MYHATIDQGRSYSPAQTSPRYFLPWRDRNFCFHPAPLRSKSRFTGVNFFVHVGHGWFVKYAFSTAQHFQNAGGVPHTGAKIFCIINRIYLKLSPLRRSDKRRAPGTANVKRALLSRSFISTGAAAGWRPAAIARLGVFQIR